MDLALKPNTSHLQRILTIRLIMVICQLVLMWFLRNSAQSQTHLLLAGVILFALSLYSSFSLIRLKHKKIDNEQQIFFQLLIDIVALTAWLYFLGGAHNPFVSYYLVPICISAALLATQFTWSLFILALAAYSLLFFINQPLIDLSAQHSHHQSNNSGIQLHFIGMWANFLISAVLISYFISRMAKTVRDQQQHLNELREQQLQNNQLTAIGSLAAGTAHELGTPLNTLLLLIEQLEQQDHDTELMKQQVKRCQDLLQKLVNTARSSQIEEKEIVAIDEFIVQLLDQWQLMRPSCSYQLSISNPDTPPHIEKSLLLHQALSNLLNNAADANPNDIQIRLNWSDVNWGLEIEDFGSGFNDEIFAQAGKQIISTAKGLGIGLLISQTTIERLGGKLELVNKRCEHSSGVIAKVSLPIKSTKQEIGQQ